MTYTFKTVAEARNHLIESGYRSTGYGKLTGHEMFEAPGLTAMIKRAPFQRGVTVTIR